MKNPDCNECVHINVSEDIQKHIHIAHKCLCYGKYLKHDPPYSLGFIKPCDECCKDDHVNYRDRKDVIKLYLSSEEFTRANPDSCIRKYNHYQTTGKILSCKDCTRVKCPFNTNI